MLNYLNPIWLLSRLLAKCGQKTYLQRVEFAAHVGFALSFALCGYFIHWGFALAMVIIAILDELIADRHWMIFHPSSFKGQRYQGDPLDIPDMVSDLVSKGLIPLVVLVIMLLK